MVECLVEKMGLETENGTLDVEQTVLKMSEFEGYDLEVCSNVRVVGGRWKGCVREIASKSDKRRHRIRDNGIKSEFCCFKYCDNNRSI